MKTFDETVDLEIKRLLQHKHYPCLAALQTFPRTDYRLKTYENFGGLFQRPNLHEDLLNYLSDYNRSQSPYFTFWAVFNDVNSLDEDQFEQAMWRELSFLTSGTTLSIAGHPFFVAGLHPASSRLSRRFPWPALVFNTFAQFDSANPMVALYADQWENLRPRLDGARYDYCF